MVLSSDQKTNIKNEIIKGLSGEPEVRKIVLFGSFLKTENPHDVDIAVFQDGSESYLPLALKYRKKLRSISRQIPVDIVPLKSGVYESPFISEVESGEVIYEK